MCAYIYIYVIIYMLCALEGADAVVSTVMQLTVVAVAWGEGVGPLVDIKVKHLLPWFQGRIPGQS